MALVWLRKNLRLHDNPSLIEAIKLQPKHIYPVYFLEPTSHTLEINRLVFLIETLKDLDDTLKKLNTRLLVIRGDPSEMIPVLFRSWNISQLIFEKSILHPDQIRDKMISDIAHTLSVKVNITNCISLYDPFDIIRANDNQPPTSFNTFLKAIANLPKPNQPLMDPLEIPPLGNITLLDSDLVNLKNTIISASNKDFSVPTVEELGRCHPTKPNPHKGGEKYAIHCLNEFFKDKDMISKVLYYISNNKFEKPKTNPAAFQPASTSLLSPHLSIGALSPRLFYYRLEDVYKQYKSHSIPPVSLMAQLYWRDFYYAVNAATPDFDKMVGNPICLQIDWMDYVDPDNKDCEWVVHLEAWKNAKTGYPWIDAIITQLREEGWIHHLARHSVACFLTRGDLFISWEHGAKVFEDLLLDFDPALNNGNWLWLSSSAFFHSYFRIYSPVTFGRKNDPLGNYVRKYLPLLKDFPLKYLFEPWKAPLDVQKAAGCVIGIDYPMPIVDHAVASVANSKKMQQAYQRGVKGKVVDLERCGPYALEFVKIHNSLSPEPVKKKKKIVK